MTCDAMKNGTWPLWASSLKAITPVSSRESHQANPAERHPTTSLTSRPLDKVTRSKASPRKRHGQDKPRTCDKHRWGGILDGDLGPEAKGLWQQLKNPIIARLAELPSSKGAERSAGTDVEESESLGDAGGIANCYRPYGKQHGVSSKKQKRNSHMI